MLIKLGFLFCFLFHRTNAADITNCAADIYAKCQLNEYFISTLEIVDREITKDRAKADDYFLRQVCKNSMQELVDFRQCVSEHAGRYCWQWNGVFDSIRLLKGNDMEISAKRYEQTFVIVEWNLCASDQRRADYFDIRACSHKRFTTPGTAFHERFSDCLGSPTPNSIELAMDKMDLCRGHNREYSCFVDSMLGEHCERVKSALLKYADIHAGHGGLHADEMDSIHFILQAAYSDHLRLPKHEECHLLVKKHEQGFVPTNIYYAILFISIVGVGVLCFHFRNDLEALTRHFFQ